MKHKLAIAGIVFGALLALGPFWGMLGTMLGMMRAFQVLGQPGVADPQELSANISGVMVSSAVGLLLCPVGLALMLCCAITLSRLKPQPPPLPGPSER